MCKYIHISFYIHINSLVNAVLINGYTKGIFIYLFVVVVVVDVVVVRIEWVRTLGILRLSPSF